MLVANGTQGRVEASRELSRGGYRCPGCEGEVILKKGQWKIAHFAHRPDAVCDFAVGETMAHLMAKQAICDAARKRGLRAEPEFVIGDQRADVAIWSPIETWSQNNMMFVVEVQHTNLSVDDLKRRIQGYRTKRISQLWLPTLRMPFRDVAFKQRHIERYPIRPFERYLAKIHENNLWFYAEAANTICVAAVDEHLIEHTGGEYGYDENAVIYPDYSYVSRRWREIKITETIAVDDLRYGFCGRRFLGVDITSAFR